MIFDADEALPDMLEAEVCIAGGGPAGIVLALELARHGRQVALVEAGGLDTPGEGHSVYEGTTSGRPYPLAGSRLRWLGGTSNHWGGWVRPLDEIDFVDKPHWPMPAWPFGKDALAPGYERAAEWCEVGSNEYDLDRAGLSHAAERLDLGPDSAFRHSLFRFSPPTRFGLRYRAELMTADVLRCWVNLNVVELIQSEDRVDAVRARTLAGRECIIRAQHFVLALGGLENPRLLLNQTRVPGNQSGLVGQCFMDHYGFTPGRLLARAGLHYERALVATQDVMVVAAPQPAEISAGLRNSALLLTPTGPDTVLPPAFWSNDLIRGDRAGESLLYRITMINESLPHRQSRVEISDQRDRLGQCRLHLHWHLPQSEFEPVLETFRRWMLEVSRRNQGRIKWLGKIGPADAAPVSVGYHHIGTTRMSADREYGVVNADCRVWDRDNLYLAGSSVFPTAGYANPTLTIAALAVKLAAHLAEQMERA